MRLFVFPCFCLPKDRHHQTIKYGWKTFVCFCSNHCTSLVKRTQKRWRRSLSARSAYVHDPGLSFTWALWAFIFTGQQLCFPFRFFFLTFIFHVFPFVPFFTLSFISHFKIHYFFILFTILDPFDTPSEQPTIIQNVVSSELRWKEGRCTATHTHTRSAALDTWLCDMAGLPWDSFKAQWHKFMIAAPHFLPKLSCCCSTERWGEERERMYCRIHEHDGEGTGGFFAIFLIMFMENSLI